MDNSTRILSKDIIHVPNSSPATELESSFDFKRRDKERELERAIIRTKKEYGKAFKKLAEE